MPFFEKERNWNNISCCFHGAPIPEAPTTLTNYSYLSSIFNSALNLHFEFLFAKPCLHFVHLFTKPSRFKEGAKTIFNSPCAMRKFEEDLFLGCDTYYISFVKLLFKRAEFFLKIPSSRYGFYPHGRKIKLRSTHKLAKGNKKINTIQR